MKFKNDTTVNICFPNSGQDLNTEDMTKNDCLELTKVE